MTAPLISDSVRIFTELRHRLLAEDPDLDEATLADTLEGATDLQERVARLCRAAIESEALATSLAGMIRDMQARRKRFDERSDRLRALALWAMQEAGLSKIIAADATITVGRPRAAVEIIDLHQLPPHLIDYEPKPNKTAIRAELEAGRMVPGAAFSNASPCLTIRTK